MPVRALVAFLLSLDDAPGVLPAPPQTALLALYGALEGGR